MTGCLLVTDVSGLTGGSTGADAAAPSDGGSPTDADSPDSAVVDAAADAKGPTACDTKKPFGLPVPVAGINTPGMEGGPRLSPDELTIYFESDREGGPASSDVFVAARARIDAPFNTPTLLANVNGPTPDYTACPTPDGLGLVFASGRDGTFAIYGASRATPTGPFGVPEKITALDTPSSDAHPIITPQGDALYFTSTRPGGAGGYDIYRVDVSPSGVGTPARVAELATPNDEITPVLSADELTIIFSHKEAVHDLWQSHRVSRTVAWPLPQRINELSSSADDFAGWMSPDNCRLYFYSRRAGGPLDVYVASRTP